MTRWLACGPPRGSGASGPVRCCWPPTPPRSQCSQWLGRWRACHSGIYPALILPAALLLWQVVRLDIHDPAGCLELFRLNRETGLAVGLAILAGRL